jgi:hypothetical protein
LVLGQRAGQPVELPVGHVVLLVAGPLGCTHEARGG